MLASQISLEADQIQFKSQNVFVNGKLKADYINVLELAAKKTFVENLVVQKLHIDSDDTTHEDFEAWFDKTNGLKIHNKGQEIFKVDTAGNVFAKNAFLQDGTFTGDIYSGPLELSNKTPSGTTLNVTAGETVLQHLRRWKTYGYAFNGKGLFNGEVIVKLVISYIPLPNIKIGESNPDPSGWMVYEIGFYSKEGNVYTYRAETTIRQGGTEEINKDEKVPYSMVFIEHIGSKTLLLKDLPTNPPTNKNYIWRDSQGFLRIT